MNSLRKLMEANSAAKLQDVLNRAVVDGDSTAEKSAMRQIVSLLGAEKAQLMLEIARRAAAERNSRKAVSESQTRVRSISEAAKLAAATMIVEAEAQAAAKGFGVTEAMKFRLDGKKHDKVKTNYPKTNFKRQADEWNEKVGAWANDHKNAGHQLLLRSEASGKTVVDAMDKEGLVSTLVVANQGESANDMTISVFNQRSGSDNEYSNPKDHKGPWKFKEFDISAQHHSDQRNVPTSKTADIRQRGRQKDGESLQALSRSSRK